MIIYTQYHPSDRGRARPRLYIYCVYIIIIYIYTYIYIRNKPEARNPTGIRREAQT